MQKSIEKVSKKSKRRDSSIVAHGEFNVLISAGIEPATFSVLTKCDNPYTTKPRDDIGADILLLDSVVDGNLSFRFNKKNRIDGRSVSFKGQQ